MAVSASLEHAGERRLPLPARLYLAHERLAIGGGTMLALLVAWEVFGRSGLVDPLFISSPTRIAQAGWQLGHDRDFWSDLQISATEFWAMAQRLRLPFRSGWRSGCPDACNTC